MVTTTAKPAETKTTTAAPLPKKLTAELLDMYKAELAKLDAVKAQLKPLTDRTDALYSHIAELMKQGDKKVRTVGDHHLKMVEKKGNVQWKEELAKRVPSEELAAIQATVTVSEVLVIS